MERNAVLRSDLALAKINDAALCRKTKPKATELSVKNFIPRLKALMLMTLFRVWDN